MAQHDHEHCQICGAHFERHGDLLKHTRKEHAQTGMPPRPPRPASQADGQEDSETPPRQNREFTRSMKE